MWRLLPAENTNRTVVSATPLFGLAFRRRKLPYSVVVIAATHVISLAALGHKSREPATEASVRCRTHSRRTEA
jgi:hypothetical protein